LTAKFSLWPDPPHLLLVLYQRVVQLHSWADAGANSAETSTKTTRETDIVGGDDLCKITRQVERAGCYPCARRRFLAFGSRVELIT